ncbi:LysE family translocator [Sediminispirochaeta smaragdinae]|uniref:Lysine exporter protein (LYSE/YGGA) n=1 Tax=Sediminispirochaeta smaragdinae (strain DSM 11293 / JCM 15392 / SEBR 4228) TaxID=573413 RepID=E1RCB3_SEDSS|nr:LysE family translocator [Sediminispirochaeta smaragdinae]ADK79993.1 Lysine exporter protein (LYSE/YGGA) [Sediminispirochaeta smaragdinae DSM 11293]
MQSIFIPVILFTLSMTITPGPNNMLLTVSGAQFGYRKNLPLIIGIVLGLQSQLVLSAMGLGLLFQEFPVIQNILKIIGTLYLLYLAFHIAFQNRKSRGKEHTQKPLTVFQGMALQYLNPKIYVTTITAMSVYTLEGNQYLASVLLITGCFLVITPLSVSVWAAFGSFLNRWMGDEKGAKGIRYALGGLTAASVVFIIL